MKNLTRILSATVLLCFFALSLPHAATAQERGNDSPRPSPNASVSQTIGTTIVTVSYSRPGIKGREIFGGLVPYGEVWRTGANEATSITFSDDVVFQGEPVEAGTYALHSVPGEDEWQIILNSKLAWGIPYDPSGELMRLPATPETGEKREQMMIYFRNVTGSSAEMVIHWDTVKVPVTIEV